MICTCFDDSYGPQPGIPASYYSALYLVDPMACPEHSPRNVILLGDVRAQLRRLPAESVHCIVTSPPYWAQRDYGIEGQLGLEPTLGEYVEDMVDVGRELWRVLRKDGTLWLNLGDGYASGRHTDDNLAAWSAENAASGGHRVVEARERKASFRRDKHSLGDRPHKAVARLKPKDLMGIPWRVALALQDDGWWLRQDNVWWKPNPTPESTTDRTTRAHEYVFHFAKSRRYYYDQEAVREPIMESSRRRISQPGFYQQTGGPKDYASTGEGEHSMREAVEGFKAAAARGQGANKRSVWEMAPATYNEDHYATFPPALPRFCIMAGTSEYGCCGDCGAPFVRILETIDPAGRLGKSYHDHEDDLVVGQRNVPPADAAPIKRTVGWRPSCRHHLPALEIRRPLVLDPFMGSGTTAMVALETARDYLGIELNPEYIALADKRLVSFKNQGRLL